MFRKLLVLLSTALMCVHCVASEEVSTIYEELARQKQQLPTKVRGALYLTDIETFEGVIRRHYQHRELDFSKLSAKQSRRISLRVNGELYEQCFHHKALIFDENVRFEYFFSDKHERLVMLATIDQYKCQAIAKLHAAMN